MARYKHIDTGPRLLAVDLHRQLRPGTFEYALDLLLDHEIDLSHFDQRYRNDEGGAPAYPPAMLLKVVLYAYSQGLLSSRAIERACREHVIFIALTGEHCPHFTTIAGFVSQRSAEIAEVFSRVLYVCQREGLIGRQMFAIDGVKLPSNASKHKSGTREEFKRQAAKLERAAREMLERHRDADGREAAGDQAHEEREKAQRLRTEARRIRRWLKDHPQDRTGANGSVRKSNRTDNDSAKMATDKGVIQGFCGVAAVDERHQIIVEAQALGSGSEQEALVPMVEAIKARELLAPDSVVTADAGYHSTNNLEKLDALGVHALVADNDMRARDVRFADQPRHKAKPDPLHDKAAGPQRPAPRYRPEDFTYDAQAGTCVCPAGHHLYRNGSRCTIGPSTFVKFTAPQSACLGCDHRARCLRHPDKTKVRQVVFRIGRAAHAANSVTEQMRKFIDSPDGRRCYDRRFATVEPVFANIRHNKRMNRFTLRGRVKVEAQWKLFCLVHNIEKIARHVELKRP